jgi:hypothetical protein
MVRLGVGILAVIALGTGHALWPVCVPLSAEQIASFQPPIAERNDEMLWGRMFRQREGQWYQCKTHIDRAGFF